ncbi:MAG: cupin domain-containing protein [Actinomycetota bacterium]|nr:cupin domain-containing protein [Actinomycetota bacterium]
MDEGRLVVAAGEGEVVLGGGFGVVSKVSGKETGGAFSIVEHPLEPGVLGAPPHIHSHEDETSFVIEGEIGVLIGEEEFRAGADSYVLKPRGVVHAFWNPGPEPARVLEIISPAGFEVYFEDLAGVLSAGGPPDLGRISEIAGGYGLTFDMERVPELLERHGLRLG